VGAFFTNVQVRSQSRSSWDALLKGLIDAAASEGRSLAEDDQADCDRSVVVGPGDDWISVYDQTTEDLSLDNLDALVTLASKIIGGSALSVFVHDSDVLELRLFDSGKLVDRYNNAPDYFAEDELTAQEAAAAAGNPQRWQALLADGRTVGDLSSCWAQKPVFAEETAWKTAELLGCTPERMTVGHRDLKEGPLPDTATELRFCLRERPVWETPAHGPPQLVDEVDMGRANSRMAVGDNLQLSMTCQNAGGAGKGLSILVSGDALAKELVKVESFQVIVGSVMEGAEYQVLSPVPQTSTDEPVLQATLPDQFIPAGVPGGMQALGGNPIKAVQVMARSQVHVNVVGSVVKAGKGTLVIRLCPGENSRQGSIDIERRLAIDSPLYRPIHAPSDISAHMLRPLIGDACLVAMVVMDAPRERTGDLAARTFEQLAMQCSELGNYEVIIYRAERGKAPKGRTASIEGYFGTVKWKRVRDEMCHEQQVFIATEPVMPDVLALNEGEMPNLHPDGHGLIVGGAPLDQSLPNDPALVAVCWWVDVSKWTPGKVAEAEALLKTSIDASMQCGDGVQAFISRWGQAPHGVDATPYEAACNIYGPVTTFKSWSTRWLRAMGTESLWIGKTLRKELDVGVEASLEAHAEVSQIGPALRIEPHSRDELPALERLLEAIIPTQQASEETTRAFYGR
jgi:hypothetical protein